jgi:hypothetical protein
VEAGPATLPSGTEITFPGKPTPVGGAVKTTTTTRTEVTLPNGGDITIDALKGGVAAHVPNGAVVAVPTGKDPGSVTATPEG